MLLILITESFGLLLHFEPEESALACESGGGGPDKVQEGLGSVLHSSNVLGA